MWLTKLIKMSVCPIISRNRANQSGFKKSRPFVYQAALSSYIVLGAEKKENSKDTDLTSLFTKTGSLHV